jgi:diaminopimelate epimerase
MIPFIKMHGIGNDFILLDGVGSSLPDTDFPALSRSVNNRRFGVGGDGLILVEKGSTAPYRMRMFNPDGSEAEMCGNGIRCFAKLLKDRGYHAGGAVDVDTGAGRLTVSIDPNGWVKVDMGQAWLKRGEIPMTGPADETFIDKELLPCNAREVNESSTSLRSRDELGGGAIDHRSPITNHQWRGTAVSMGNPHLVIFVDDVHAIDLEKIGPVLEHHPLFPKRVNVHFAQVADRDHLIMRTWERGAGITFACGTGACSVAVAGFLTGRSERSVDIRLPGGHLKLDYLEDGKVLMTGPAETVFEGEWLG